MSPIIAAVIVTHNPPDGMAERLDAILSQIDQVIIVDNCSENLSAPRSAKLDIIRNDRNEGLAAALNHGIRRALGRNADWVLLLDHDSKPEAGMVERMLAAYQAYPENERIGIIAPEIKEQNIASETRYLMPKGKLWFRRASLMETNDEALSVITSGSLIKAKVFKNIGLMPEHFFIDYIDHAFCLKLKQAGYKILLVKDAVLSHRLGDKKQYGLKSAAIIVSNHSPERRYTIFRNRIWVWKRYVAVFPGFVAHDVLAAGYDVFRIVFYEKEKGRKLKAIFKGIRAGMQRELENR